MFLDAALKLSIFGPIILLGILLGGVVYVGALVRTVASCRRLLREGEIEQFWLTIALMLLLTVPIAVLIFRAALIFR